MEKKFKGLVSAAKQITLEDITRDAAVVAGALGLLALLCACGAV